MAADLARLRAQLETLVRAVAMLNERLTELERDVYENKKQP